MTMEAHDSSAGGAAVDLSMLQLDEFVSAKLRVEDLFLEWITAENTQRMIDMLLDDSNNKAAVVSTPPVVPEGTKTKRDAQTSSPSKGVARKSPKKRTQAEMGSAGTHLQEQHRAKTTTHNKEWVTPQSRAQNNAPLTDA